MKGVPHLFLIKKLKTGNVCYMLNTFQWIAYHIYFYSTESLLLCFLSSKRIFPQKPTIVGKLKR